MTLSGRSCFKQHIEGLMAEVATDSGEPEGSRDGSPGSQNGPVDGIPVAAEASTSAPIATGPTGSPRGVSSAQSRYFTNTTSFCASL